MGEYFSGRVQAFEAFQRAEKQKGENQLIPEKVQQVERLHNVLSIGEKRRGVIYTGNLREANLNTIGESDVASVVMEEDIDDIVRDMLDLGYEVERISAGAGVRLLVKHKDSSMWVSHDFVLGRQNSRGGDLIDIEMGENTVHLEVSSRSAKLGETEVPLISVQNREEMQQSYYEALENADFQTITKLTRLLTKDEIHEIEGAYVIEEAKAENYEAATAMSDEEVAIERVSTKKELLEQHLKDLETDEEAAARYEWEPVDVEFGFTTLQEEIMRMQMAIDEALNVHDVTDDQRLTADQAYEYVCEYMQEQQMIDQEADAESWSTRAKLLSALPQIEGERTKDELIMIMESLVLNAVDQSLIEKQLSQGEKNSFKLTIAKKKNEQTESTG